MNTCQYATLGCAHHEGCQRQESSCAYARYFDFLMTGDFGTKETPEKPQRPSRAIGRILRRQRQTKGKAIRRSTERSPFRRQNSRTSS